MSRRTRRQRLGDGFAQALGFAGGLLVVASLVWSLDAAPPVPHGSCNICPPGTLPPLTRGCVFCGHAPHPEHVCGQQQTRGWLPDVCLCGYVPRCWHFWRRRHWNHARRPARRHCGRCCADIGVCLRRVI